MPDRAIPRLQSAWTSDRRARSLWSSPVSLVAEGVDYLRQLATGRPAPEGLAPAKRDVFHDALGLAPTTGEANPLFARASSEHPSSILATRRLDRIGRLSRDAGSMPFQASSGPDSFDTTPPNKGSKSLPFELGSLSKSRIRSITDMSEMDFASDMVPILDSIVIKNSGVQIEERAKNIIIASFNGFVGKATLTTELYRAGDTLILWATHIEGKGTLS